jgi:ABC-type microcin C transport system permease subunit YejB
MAQFIVLRLLHTILILFGVSIVAFGLIHLIPGNPLDILLPPEAPSSVAWSSGPALGALFRNQARGEMTDAAEARSRMENLMRQAIAEPTATGKGLWPFSNSDCLSRMTPRR